MYKTLRPHLISTDEDTKRRMRLIRTRNTSIEKQVRSAIHRLGLRFRLNSKLEGKPDVVLPKYKTAVFVHGCFWHGHESCKKGQTKPVRNAGFWLEKIQRNKERDVRVEKILIQAGWKVLTIWECQTKDRSELNDIIKRTFDIKSGK